jgi:hypothetical protein
MPRAAAATGSAAAWAATAWYHGSERRRRRRAARSTRRGRCRRRPHAARDHTDNRRHARLGGLVPEQRHSQLGDPGPGIDHSRRRLRTGDDTDGRHARDQDFVPGLERWRRDNEERHAQARQDAPDRVGDARTRGRRERLVQPRARRHVQRRGCDIGPLELHVGQLRGTGQWRRVGLGVVLGRRRQRLDRIVSVPV